MLWTTGLLIEAAAGVSCHQERAFWGDPAEGQAVWASGSMAGKHWEL